MKLIQTILIIGLCAGAAHAQNAEAPPKEAAIDDAGPKNIVVVTTENFNEIVIDGKTPVLVDFWATWCGPCLAMAPTLEEVAADFEGELIIAKIDVDQSPELAKHLKVRGLPTLMLFQDGEPVDSIVGGVSKKVLVRMIKKNGK
ncbi:MAG: thioredoxin 1 [Verrucomicrobiales bacterium]|jgi:thioredoxin 1